MPIFLIQIQMYHHPQSPHHVFQESLVRPLGGAQLVASSSPLESPEGRALEINSILLIIIAFIVVNIVIVKCYHYHYHCYDLLRKRLFKDQDRKHYKFVSRVTKIS